MASLRRRARHTKHLHRIAPPADVVGSHLQAAAGRELSEEVEGPDVTETDESFVQAQEPCSAKVRYDESQHQ
jgi:hypothetical protein